MSVAWKYICPVCDSEFTKLVGARDHCRAKHRDPLHSVAARLDDAAFENPAYGEKHGDYQWPAGSPQDIARQPLYDAQNKEKS